MVLVVFLFTSPVQSETAATMNISLVTGSWPMLIDYSINDTGTGHVTISINDSADGTIRHLDCGDRASGTYAAPWDARTDNGSLIGADNYTIVINYTPDAYIVKAQWGGVGSATGQLDRPSDIAVDSTGNVYVAEYDNHRVQKFDTAGRSLGTWGGYGSGEGQFEYPAGIAIGNNGIVYVSDLENSRIEMFSEDGGFIGQWGNAGTGNGEFSMPHGIAIDGSGDVYVADMGNHRIQKFTATGKFLGGFGGYGKSDGRFMSPAGITISGNTVIVSDIDRNRIQSFSIDGTYRNGWGSTGSGVGQFNGAAGLTTDGGHIFIADMNNHRIQKFDLSGQFIGMISAYGPGDINPAAPTGIATDGTGDIYVADISNDNIEKLFYDQARESLAIQKSTNVTVGDRNPVDKESSVSALDTGMTNMASAQGSNGPDTYINLTGVAGNNSWYRSNVTITLSAYPKSGTVVAETRYSLDGKNWATYIGPFNVTSEGTTTISYYSTDNQGNGGDEQSANVRIDKTPPSVTGTILTNPIAGGWYTGSVTVHFSATDSLSGVVNVTPDETISVNGVTNMTGSANDLAGNIGNVAIRVPVDNKPPKTGIVLTGTAGANGWFTSDVGVNFTAVDGESGVKNTEYSLDGGIWKLAGPIVINKEGETTVYYRSTDAVGNVELVNTIVIKVDKTAPAITGTPDRQPDVNGWYTAPVTVTFSATDAYSGVATLSQPVTLPKDNIPLDGPYQSIMGTATDTAGNTASTVVGNLNIDMFTPITTCKLEGSSGGSGDNTWYRSNVTVTLTAKDAGSGVHDIQYSLNGIDWLDYHPFVVSSEGITAVYYRSTDNVGHKESVQTAYVRIDKTNPVVTYDIITNPGANGWYTEPVVIHFIATDDRSGIVSVTPDVTLSSDGTNQSVAGYATDIAGNTGSVTIKGLNLDISAPVTSCSLNRTPNPDGWFNNSDVGVTLSTMGTAGLGSSKTLYSFDGKNWQTYASPLTVTGEGNNILYFYSTDNFSHQEPLNAQNIRIDRTKPLIIGVPDRQPDLNSWYTHNVTVHFNAFDAHSGIKNSTADTVLVDGKDQTVDGVATDMAGNANTTVAGPFSVDGTPPVTTCAFSGTPGNNGWYKSSGGVTLNANDGNGIGVNYTMYRLDNGPWTKGTQFTIPDGTHTIYYYSSDLLNNTETIHTQTVKIDSTPPTIHASRSILSTSNGWYNNTVTIHFTASDDLSGLASVSPDVTLSNEGTGQSAVGTATDNAGNVATDNENNINIDKTTPSTNYTLSGTAGQNGWNTSDVKVSFNITDLSTLNCYHSLDGQHWSTDNPTTISTEGSLTGSYYSVDKANNTEAVKTFNLKIDKSAPTVNYTVSGTQGLAGAYRSDVAVGFIANDSVSGLANAYYTLDGTTWKPMANFTVTTEGDYDIQYNATDNAGNKASGDIQFSIYKTPPTVNTTTPQADADGVLTDGQPVVTFNGRLDTSSLNNSTVTLTTADGENVNGTLRYVENGNTSTVTFIPSEELQPYTMYTMSLSTDVKDPAGNHLTSPYTLTFTTGNTDSTGTEFATPTPAPTLEPTPTPTPKPGGLPIIGSLPSIPTIPLVIFLAVIAVGGVAFIYLTRIRK